MKNKTQLNYEHRRELMNYPIELEKKRNNKFLFIFPEEFEIPPYFIEKITNPFFNGSEWDEIVVTFIDSIGPSTTKSLIKALNILLERKYKKEQILFEFEIHIIDPALCITEIWNFPVMQFPKIDLGLFDYSNDENRTPKMIIKPEQCININIKNN